MFTLLLAVVLAAVLCGLISRFFKPSPSGLNQVLFYLDNARRVPVTVKHVVENVAVFGGTGSGKDSGPDQTIIQAEMAYQGYPGGFGILGSGPKPSSGDQITRWARERGREDDVIIVSPTSGHVFPVLDWLVKQGDGPAVVSEAVTFLRDLSEVSDRGRMNDGGGEAKFFASMADRINFAVMTVDLGANRAITPASCLEIIQTIPATVHDAQTLDSYCKRTCERALEKCGEAELPQVRRSVELLMGELAALDPRPKGSCTVSATVMWSALGQYPLDRMFTGEGNVITPQAVLDGAILLVAVPFGCGMDSAARISFNIYKLCLQKLLLARGGQPNLRPVTLLLSEGQNYLSTADKYFVAQCRESVASFHYSSQSIASALSEVEKKHVDSILASLGFRCYVQNNCDLSNEMASMDFGEHEIIQTAASGGLGEWDPLMGQRYQNANVSFSKMRKRVTPPEEFKYMRRGGGPTALVEARVRILNHDGMTGFKCFFDQNVGQRKRSWLDRFRSNEVDIVNLP